MTRWTSKDIEKLGYSKSQQAGTKRQVKKVSKKRAHKYGARRTEYAGIHFRSKLEADYAAYLDILKAAGEVETWEYESRKCKFKLELDGLYYGSYTIDFFVKYADGSEEYIETKGAVTRDFAKTFKVFRHCYPDIPARIQKYVPKIR